CLSDQRSAHLRNLHSFPTRRSSDLEQQIHARMRAVERRDDQPAARREQHDGFDDLDRAEQRDPNLPTDHRERIDRNGREERASGDPDEPISEPLPCHAHIHSTEDARRQVNAGKPASAVIRSRYAITASARSSSTQAGRPGGSTQSGTTPYDSLPSACAITMPSAPCTASGWNGASV